MPQTQLIELKNITQNFKIGQEVVEVIKQCDVAFETNSFNIIYGPSGSGKSTLLNILSGIQHPTSGTVTYDGTNIYNYSKSELAYFRAQRIGVVYQQNYWIGSLNAVENVAMSLLFSGLHRGEANKRAMEALEKVGIARLARKNPQYLSGGEQQRVAIARAIVTDPDYIIADEPTGSLDMKNGDQIMALLQNYQAKLNRTIILVTHNLEYLPLAQRLVRVQDGMCEQLGRDAIRSTAESIIVDMRQRMTNISRARQTR